MCMPLFATLHVANKCIRAMHLHACLCHRSLTNRAEMHARIIKPEMNEEEEEEEKTGTLDDCAIISHGHSQNLCYTQKCSVCVRVCF